MTDVIANNVTWDELKRELGKVNKPARYTGGEWNASMKDPASVQVRFALAFPDVYEVGMSHLGSEILYHILNQRADVACERVYAPWYDMEHILRKKGWGLFTIENRLPLDSLDIIGFSLQYELTYTNVLAMLELGKIPLKARMRNKKHPLIIAGGPCAMACEPLADYLDAVVLGDGEEVILEIVDVYSAWKDKGSSRESLLLDMSEIRGVYVPSLFDVSYNSDGTVSGVSGLAGRETVKKRVVSSLEDAEFPGEPLVPLIPPVHDRAMVEVFRGCSQGCRFCQAGMIYRPVRERKTDTVENLARQKLKATGYPEVSLVSLSTADYSHIETVLSRLLALAPCGAKVSLPSLRVDSFSVGLSQKLGLSKKTGLTFAPEAGSQRLRDVINKRVTEQEIFKAAKSAFSIGYSRIKLYFMIGLPTETDEDVLSIATLAKKIRQIGRDMGIKPSLIISVSGFVPKPNTPFQWDPCLDKNEMKRRQKLLGKHLRGPGLEYKYHDVNLTMLEAVFSRGDRKLGRVLEVACRRGVRFDAWTESDNHVVWDEIFREYGVDTDFYTIRQRDYSEVFPWDHLDTGVRKEFLWNERHKAMLGVTTEDCRKSGCAGCGICSDFGLSMEIYNDSEQ